MATDEDTPLRRLLGPYWELQDSPHLQSSHPHPRLALLPVLQEDDSASRGADSSRWIMEIKLCVCSVIKSNALTVAPSPGPSAQVVLPYLWCTGRLPGHVVLIGAGAPLVSRRKVSGEGVQRCVGQTWKETGLVLPEDIQDFVLILQIEDDLNLACLLWVKYSFIYILCFVLQTEIHWYI